MAIQVLNDTEAKVLAQAVKDGKIPDARRAEAMSALRGFIANPPKQALIESGELPALQEEQEPTENLSAGGSNVLGAIGDFAVNVGKDLGAVAEVGATIATGGAAEIAAGFGNAMKLLVGASTPEQAAADIEATSDLFTFQPRTERGQKLLETIATPLLALERGADRVADVLSLGNPEAATLIKTGLVGGAELAIPGKAASRKVLGERQIARQKKKVQQKADEIGVSLEPAEFEASLVESAKRMTPEQRAQNAPALQAELRNAAQASKAEKNALFEAALQKKAFVRVDNVKEFSAGLRRSLEERGFDLEPGVEGFGKVRKNLKRLDEFGDRFATKGINVKAASLNELEMIRRNINKSFGADRQANAALTSMRRGIDDFMDHQFDTAAISGDKTAIKAWKDARAANTRWHRNFSEDKVIAKLIDQDATPETISQWLTGATAMGARKEAASTVSRIKKVLGKDHPAIEGIRQDYLFNLAEPLLQEKPNFNQFLRNYDNSIRRNPSLVRELDLNNSDLSKLQKFVKERSGLPVAELSTIDIHRAVAQALTGHQIARAGLRVRLASALARLATGVDRVTKKRIIAELAGAMYDQPAIPKKSTLAAEFIAGAALTGITDAQEAQNDR